MSRLGLTRDKIYKTVARQLHGVVPCWVCGQPVAPQDATLDFREGGTFHYSMRTEGGMELWGQWLIRIHRCAAAHRRAPALLRPSLLQ